MRRALIAVVPAALLGLAGSASAAPAVVLGLSPLPNHLSARCAEVGTIPNSAQISTPVFAAHVSVANCTAEEAMNRLSLAPDDASIRRLNAAVAPSLGMLDEVIRAGNPYWTMVAEDAKRDLYTGMVVRMRASIPNADPAKHAALERKLAPYIADAGRARSELAALARQHPDAAGRDAVIAGIVARTTASQPWVATRPARSR